MGERLDRLAADLALLHRRRAAGPRSGRARSGRRSRASAPSRAPPGRRGARSAAPRARGSGRGTSRRPAPSVSSGPAPGVTRLAEPGGDLALDLLVDGREQLPLAVEVVVERPAGHPGRADDLLGADRGVAALGEQRAARRRSAPPACSRDRSAWVLLDIHTACMLETYCLYVTPRPERTARPMPAATRRRHRSTRAPSPTRETGPADAPAIVFVHGAFVDGTLWRKVVPRLEGSLPLRRARPAARLARDADERRRRPLPSRASRSSSPTSSRRSSSRT